MKRKRTFGGVLFAAVRFTGAGSSGAKSNYEIEVYESDLVETGHTMVELHSYFTFPGTKTTTDGTRSTNHC